MNIDKKKITLFNKCYKEMQEGVKKTLKKGNDKIYKVKSVEEIERFCRQIDENSKEYKEQNTILFDNVIILKSFFHGKPSLNNANKTIVWKYLDAMYSIGSGKKKDKTPVVKNSQGLENLVNSLVSDEDSGFKDMIEDISKQLENTMKGKDINQATLISDLMSGNLQSSGIDFKSIIENTTKSLKDKVDRGEVDIAKLQETGEKIKKALPNKF